MSKERFFTKDFPKPGVNFLDVLQVLNEFKDSSALTNLLPYGRYDVTIILPETLGYLFYQDGYNHIFLRKDSNKIPGDVITFTYKNEYSTGEFSYRSIYLNNVPKDAIVIDDVLATGNTVLSIRDHFRDTGTLNVLGIVAYAELESLHGRDLLESQGLVVKSVHKF